MKHFKVYTQLSKSPELLGLPMNSGWLFFGLSIGNVLLCLFIHLQVATKLALGLGIPALLYGCMHLLQTIYPDQKFAKHLFSIHITVIKNRSRGIFYPMDAKMENPSSWTEGEERGSEISKKVLNTFFPNKC